MEMNVTFKIQDEKKSPRKRAGFNAVPDRRNDQRDSRGKHRRKKQRCFPKLSSICFNPRFGGVHQAEGATNDHLLGGR